MSDPSCRWKGRGRACEDRVEKWERKKGGGEGRGGEGREREEMMKRRDGTNGINMGVIMVTKKWCRGVFSIDALQCFLLLEPYHGMMLFISKRPKSYLTQSHTHTHTHIHQDLSRSFTMIIIPLSSLRTLCAKGILDPFQGLKPNPLGKSITSRTRYKVVFCSN
jgi:hypothetical protein